MYSAKQFSKSSGLGCIEHISMMAGIDSNRYQTSLRWLLQKHTTRCQVHLTRDARKNMCPVNPLNLSKNVSVMKFIFCKVACLNLQFCKNSIAHVFLGIYCILSNTYFSEKTWLTAFEMCSEKSMICNYSKTRKMLPSCSSFLHILKLNSQFR